MAVQNPASINDDYLYRLLRQHDEPSEGLYPTNRFANISIEEHVEREGHDVWIHSQFISTTRDPRVVLRWLFCEGRKGRNGTIAIISRQRMDPHITLDDISEGRCGLTKYYNDLVIKHKEVLVRPFVNSDAIIGVFSYSDLSTNGLARKDFIDNGCKIFEDQQQLDNWLATEEAIERFYSTHCSFCMEPDHDDNGCLELYILLN